MNNWKIVSQIASGFGIVSIVFAVFAAVTNYELFSIEYGSSAPASFYQVSAIESMIVFLLLAVLSFVVAWITMGASREKGSEEMPSVAPEPEQETQNEQETQTEEIKP